MWRERKAKHRNVHVFQQLGNILAVSRAAPLAFVVHGPLHRHRPLLSGVVAVTAPAVPVPPTARPHRIKDGGFALVTQKPWFSAIL